MWLNQLPLNLQLLPALVQTTSGMNAKTFGDAINVEVIVIVMDKECAPMLIGVTEHQDLRITLNPFL